MPKIPVPMPPDANTLAPLPPLAKAVNATIGRVAMPNTSDSNPCTKEDIEMMMPKKKELVTGGAVVDLDLDVACTNGLGGGVSMVVV